MVGATVVVVDVVEGPSLVVVTTDVVVEVVDSDTGVVVAEVSVSSPHETAPTTAMATKPTHMGLMARDLIGQRCASTAGTHRV